MSDQLNQLIQRYKSSVAKAQGTPHAQFVEVVRGLNGVTVEFADGTSSYFPLKEFEEIVQRMEGLSPEPSPEGVNTTGLSFGLLIWWSIRQGVYDLATLQQVAQEVKLTPAISEYLTGADAKSAWFKATNLGSKGVPSYAYVQPGCRAYYTVRDVGNGEPSRALVREMLDDRQKKVGSRQVALLGLDEQEGVVTCDIDPSIAADAPVLLEEVSRLIDGLQEEIDRRIGQIDDKRIRHVITQWLGQRHRVSMRGKGGVYYLPMTPQTQTALREEVLGVRAFCQKAGVGTLSVVQLTKDGATSVEDFQDSAVEEILSEIAAVQESLDSYESNENQNWGSVKFSAQAQAERLAKLAEKVNALEEALGSVLDKVQVQFTLAEKRARKIALRAAQAIAENHIREKSVESSRKAGTASSRKRKVRL